MTDGFFRDVTGAKIIELIEEVVRYNSPSRHEARITALQQIFQESYEIFRYFPCRLLNVTIRDLDGDTYENQPVILCDGPKDEAVIWQKPRKGDGHPDLGLYVFNVIE